MKKSIGATLLPASLHEKMQFERYFIHEFVRDQAIPRMSSETRVLDAGSGRLPEQYLREEILGTGAKLETLDLFPGEGVDHAGDIANMPFDDASYDMVLCTQVLEHVPNPTTVCKELRRVVTDNGWVVVTAPQSAFLHNLPYHFFHFTNVGFETMLNEADLDVVTCLPQGGHFANLAVQLHYSAKVFRQAESKGLAKVLAPLLSLVSRILFGLLGKLLALFLDKAYPFEGNTQGWCLLCQPTKLSEAGESEA